MFNTKPMDRKTAAWIGGYIAVVIAVAALSYLAVAWYFKMPPPLPFGLDRLIAPYFSEERMRKLVPLVIPTPDPAHIFDPSNFIIRQEAGPSPVYVLRVDTVGQLIQVDTNTIRGAAYITVDPKKVVFSFVLKGSDGKFTVGYHAGGGFREYATSVNQESFEEVRRHVPEATFVQLRVATQGLSSAEKKKVMTALDGAARGRWNMKDLTLAPFALELTGP